MFGNEHQELLEALVFKKKNTKIKEKTSFGITNLKLLFYVQKLLQIGFENFNEFLVGSIILQLAKAYTIFVEQV